MQEPSPLEEDCDCSSTVTDEIPSIHLQEINSIITSIKKLIMIYLHQSILITNRLILTEVLDQFLVPGSDFPAVTHAKAGLDTVPS